VHTHTQPNVKIRAQAFDLFGALSRFGQGGASHTFYEQLHVALLPLILHVNDDAPDVRAVRWESVARHARRPD
jgi:hypothetical protein